MMPWFSTSHCQKYKSVLKQWCGVDMNKAACNRHLLEPVRPEAPISILAEDNETVGFEAI